MTDLWNLKKFGDCADLIRDTIAPEAAQNVPYIGLEHIIEGGLALSGYGFSDDVISAKNRFKKGDILFGKLRPYFRKVIIAPFDGVCSTDIWVVRAKPGIEQRFLFYWMASLEFVEEATRASEGTKMPRAKWEFVSRIENEIPPLPAQRTIAHILGSLDDKIKVNRQMNKTLEVMARAIFQSWFVDFDPVLVKAEGMQPEGMDAATAALFPSEFEEIEGREVPKGWGVVSLGNVIDLGYGKALKQENRLSGKIPVYGSNGQIGWHDEKLVDGPGIIVGRKGNPGIIHWSTTDFFPIDTTFFVIPKGSIRSLYYLYHELQRQDLPSLGADSAVPGLNRNLVYMSKILVPSSKILNKFDILMESLDQIIHNNNNKSRTLVTLRDSLLPKLMSGEITVGFQKNLIEVK